MDHFNEARRKYLEFTTRRHFLKKCSTGLGMLAFGSLMGMDKMAGLDTNGVVPHFAPKAKRVIYLHMAGAPSQLELFDYKPVLEKLNGQDCPPSLLEGKRFAFIEGVPQMLGPQQKFRQRGEAGNYVSDAMPHLASVADKLTFLKAVHTDEFNHAPAQLLIQTGSSRVGRPSIGSWVTYGLGSENENLPGYMVLISGGNNPDAGKNAWGSGFLPSEYQGVQCRNSGDPILFVSNPDGISRDIRGRSLDALKKLNEAEYNEIGDPEILSRISQYEMAFKMQISVPESMDIKDEPDYIKKMYGIEDGSNTFANNCLLARKLAEKGVRFIQLYDWGWDMHGTSENGSVDIGIRKKSKEIDQPIAALLKDLEQRGMMEDTLVVWGGEFGRTPMRENRKGEVMSYLGRDHHVDAFTVWMAGAGLKAGYSHGETDDIGYFGVKDRTHIHDLQATILHLLGMNHEEFTYRFQGRDFRLTDVHGHVIDKVLA